LFFFYLKPNTALEGGDQLRGRKDDQSHAIALTGKDQRLSLKMELN
jgi:hypothetical protein